jgi:hypothetical protein
MVVAKIRIKKGQTLIGSIGKNGKLAEGPFQSNKKAHKDLNRPNGAEAFTIACRGSDGKLFFSGSSNRKLSSSAERALKKLTEVAD